LYNIQESLNGFRDDGPVQMVIVTHKEPPQDELTIAIDQLAAIKKK